jgi:hypothetical protein
LTDLTVDTNAGDPNGAGVMGVVDISADGSYQYFVAEGALTAGAVSGQPNLYLAHAGTTTLIATLGSSDSSDWLGLFGVGIGSNTARETPDGKHFAFMSSKSLTGYDNRDTTTGEPDSEVFFYDATLGVLECASCNPTGARPLGPSRFGDENASSFTALGNDTPRNFSEDGRRLFFDSRDALAPHDSNGLQDVYEYESGHVYPVSNVVGHSDSFFVDASAGGADAFISTEDPLLPQDSGLRADVYDARVGGGFPASLSSPPACKDANSCKGAVSQPPVFQAPASAVLSGPGNLAPPVAGTTGRAKAKTSPSRCRRGLAKRRGRCVRTKRCRAAIVKKRAKCPAGGKAKKAKSKSEAYTMRRK